MDFTKKVGFVALGEVNTPIEKLMEKHDMALKAVQFDDCEVYDAGLVIDDPKYKTADAAIKKLKKQEFDVLLLCVCGWIPTHAVIRVTDEFRHTPMILWGLCGWVENGNMLTTAEQAGTTAIRPTFQEMHYTFKYFYNVIGEEMPLDGIHKYITAAHAAKALRRVHVGTMGYRDMLLYGTQFEGFSMRRDLGVEVETFEMLEMTQYLKKVKKADVDAEVAYIKKNWKFDAPVDAEVEDSIEKAVRYALAVGRKIEERGWEAVTLNDVDGMKKLCGFPPAPVFMILMRRYGIPTTPENDVMGNVTQVIAKLLTGQISHYMEYYEFGKDSVLIGDPDYVPEEVVDGDVHILPAPFGLLSKSLVNVSKVKTGYVTNVRLIFSDGKYKLHMYQGDAKTPESWNEYGWGDPAPHLCSLRVFLDTPVEDFAEKVGCQHVIVTYGDNKELFEDFAQIMGIEII